MALFQRESDLGRLVDRCRKGDGRAWSELVDRFEGLVFSIARRVGLNTDDSADVVQVTFQALFKALNTIQNPQTLPKWLSITASRESLRIKRGDRTVSAEDIAMPLDEVISSDDVGAEELVQEAFKAQELRDSVKSLPERCRELVQMLYFEPEITYDEVGSRLGIPLGSIGPTRARCLEKLRKQLEDMKFFG